MLRTKPYQYHMLRTKSYCYHMLRSFVSEYYWAAMMGKTGAICRPSLASCASVIYRWLLSLGEPLAVTGGTGATCRIRPDFKKPSENISRKT